VLAEELPAAVLAAQRTEVEHQLEAITASPSQGHGQDASAADSPAAAAAREYAQGAPGTERPYGPETASVASEGKGEKRHVRQSHCHDSNAAPYTFVLMLDMVREAWEDQSRHRQDV
jgi:hypothetical protein